MKNAVFVCSFLFLMYLVNTQALSSFLFLRIHTSVFISAICSFIGFSNHFILTMDIIVFFTMMIPIIFHTLKITQSLSAR